MIKILKNYKRELVVVLFLFILLVVLISPVFIFTIKNFFIIGFLGLILLFSWFIAIYFLYANRKVSRYGELLIRVRLVEKLFNFFVLPTLFYIFVICAIFFITSVYLNLFIIASFSIILFVLLVHIRSSYQKVFYLSSLTKVVYDAVLIMIFFLGVFVANSLGLSNLNLILLSVILSLFLLGYKLIIEGQINWSGFGLLLTSTLLISLVTFFTREFNLFVVTAVNTLIFYLIVAMWSIRLRGYTEWKDYSNPMLYTLMGLILIFSL